MLDLHEAYSYIFNYPTLSSVGLHKVTYRFNSFWMLYGFLLNYHKSNGTF